MSNWDDLSDAEKLFLENQFKQVADEFKKNIVSALNDNCCCDCSEEFDDTNLNRQSTWNPSICVVCEEYRGKNF